MPTSQQPPESDTPSAEYLSLTARMNAWEVWADMTAAEKREQILSTFPATAWSEREQLLVLAVFVDDPVEWIRISARGREIGVNVFQLERACKALRDEQRATQLPHMNGVHELLPPESLSIEEQRQRVYDSRDIAVWHAALDLFIDLVDDAGAWFLVTGKAKAAGQDVRAFEKAVRQAKADHKKARTRHTSQPVEPTTIATQNCQEALDMLSEEWGIPIVECIRHGKDNATWHLKLVDGKEIGIGSSKNLLSELAVRIAIFDVTGVAIKHYGKAQQDKWRELVQIIAAFAVTVDTPEMTARGQAIALIDGYLTMRHTNLTRESSDAEWKGLVTGKHPFVRNGMIHIHAQDMWVSYVRTMRPDIESRTILEFFRMLGFHRVTIALKEPKTSRSMWAIPLETLLRLLEENRPLEVLAEDGVSASPVPDSPPTITEIPEYASFVFDPTDEVPDDFVI